MNNYYDSLLFNKYYIEAYKESWVKLELGDIFNYASWKAIHKNIHKIPKDSIYIISDRMPDSLQGRPWQQNKHLPDDCQNVFHLTFKLSHQYYPYYTFVFRDDARLLTTSFIINFEPKKDDKNVGRFLSKYIDFNYSDD